MAKTLEAARKEISEMKVRPTEANGFKPVIVKTEYAPKKYTFGVQFWSEFLINQKWSTNSDSTRARLVEMV